MPTRSRRLCYCVCSLIFLVALPGCGASDQVGQQGSALSDDIDPGIAREGAPEELATAESSGGAAASPDVQPDTVAGSTPDVDVSSSGVALPQGRCLSEAGQDVDGNLTLMATAQNNYAFQSAVQVETTTVAANSDVFFDWSSLTSDFMGHALDPMADIDTLAVIVWELGHEEMLTKLNADALGAPDAAAAIALYTNQARQQGSLFEFTVAGGGTLPREELMKRLDPLQYPQESYTYTAMAMSGTELGHGIRMVHEFKLDPLSTNSHVAISPESTTLDYAVDLTSLTPVFAPLGQGNIVVDWSTLTVNAMGREFLERSVNEVMVARYALDSAQLEQQFLDLDLIAEQLYRAPVPAGSRLNLNELSSPEGVPFAGIDDQGTWIVALVCGKCGNPAPWFITRLEPCAP